MYRRNGWTIGIPLMVCVVFLVSCSEDMPEQAETAVPASQPAPAQPAPPASAPLDALQVQETNIPGVVAEILECKRKEGVLTVKVRFRNNSGEQQAVKMFARPKYEPFYVIAESKKYLVLKDSEDVALAPPMNGWGNVEFTLEAGSTHLWWGKFPAPPAEVKTLSFVMPQVLPFDDVPIADD